MSARILVVDNIDSFTFNLVQALREKGATTVVRRSDELTLAEADALDPTHVVISPGPGHPADAGVTLALIRSFLGRVPLLGVCLGHQALAVACGGRVAHAREPRHGKTTRIYHDGHGLFRGLPLPFEAGRYHSLCVEEAALGDGLEISAWSPEGEVMGLRHQRFAANGVQFHPESILTPDGPRLLDRFLESKEPLRLAETSA